MEPDLTLATTLLRIGSSVTEYLSSFIGASSAVSEKVRYPSAVTRTAYLAGLIPFAVTDPSTPVVPLYLVSCVSVTCAPLTGLP